MIKKCLSNKVSLVGLLISVMMIFVFLGCTSSPKGFDPAVKAPQMIVEPCTISLGVATLAKTPIVFKGKGFQPGDSVFIQLLDVYNRKDKAQDIPVAEGDVDSDGNFTAKVGTLAKVSEILRAQIGSNEKMETVIIVSQPPIPEGVYTAKAISMESDKTAECKLTVKGPSMIDSIKDWLGGLMGKIKKTQ